MRVKEIFYSLQGEGFLVGRPSVFIRLAGCPLCCRWCDTKYALDEKLASDQAVSEITVAVRQWPTEFIVITGGEPLVHPDLSLQAQLSYLTQQLKAIGKHITIETAGIGFIPGLTCDLMSISPKLTNSLPCEPRSAAVHERSRLNVPILRKLVDNYNCQLKFVVDSESDLPEILDLLKKIGPIDPHKIMLMPQAATRNELLAKSPMIAGLCKQIGFTFCQRLQILLWNNERGR